MMQAQFNKFVAVVLNKNTTAWTSIGQRQGQYAFNKLYEMNPTIASKIRGTEFDPFYNDSRISLFLDEVEKYVK